MTSSSAVLSSYNEGAVIGPTASALAEATKNSEAAFHPARQLFQQLVALLRSRPGVRRLLTFGLVGFSGVAVNTGSLLALQKLGFDPIGWPIWAATELSILWNYNLNRRITWRERKQGRWWVYNLAAAFTSLSAIGVTSVLVRVESTPVWLASLTGIGVGTVISYLLLDRVVFAGLPKLSRWLERARPSAAGQPPAAPSPLLASPTAHRY